MHTIQCCYCLCFWVKQMPKNTIFVESTKWICQMNLSRWMYFDCGALLLYQTRQSQTCVKKVTPRPAHTVKLSRRKFKKKETCWPCTTSLVFLLSRFGYIYLVHSTGLEPVSRRVKSAMSNNIIRKSNTVSRFFLQLSQAIRTNRDNKSINPCRGRDEQTQCSQDCSRPLAQK
jgi:hypothetical protein